MSGTKSPDPATLCEHVELQLPWLIGGGLSHSQRELIQRHLQGCGDCRSEYESTIVALEVYDAHLPVEVLLDYALHGESEYPGELVRSHLETCASCQREFDRVRAAWENRTTDVPPATRHWGRSVLVASVAATLLVAIGSLSWLQSPTVAPAPSSATVLPQQDSKEAQPSLDTLFVDGFENASLSSWSSSTEVTSRDSGSS